MSLHRFKRVSCIALLTTMLPTTLLAATPPIYPEQIPVSGILTDAEGQPLDDFHEVELRVHDNERGGEPLYTESFDVEGSRLDVALGSKTTTGMPSLTELVLKADALYLELVIDGEVQRPRLRLGAVPYAIHAKQATSADHATECGDAASVGGKAASEFLPSTYTPPAPTWSQLADKPSFNANAPLTLDVQGSAHVFSLAPCTQAGQVLSWSGGSWGCQPLPAPLMASTPLKIVGNTIMLEDDSIEEQHLVGGAVSASKLADGAVSTSKLEDAAVTSDKIANSAVQNQHIGAGTLLPNKISGGAVTLLSLTAQNIMNTLTIAQGIVSVFGELKAGSYKFTSPVRRTYRVWADQFQHVYQANAPVADLTTDNHLYVSRFLPGNTSLPGGVTPPPYSVTLIASVPSLPNDSVLDKMTCFYINGNGSMADSSFKIVTTGKDTTAALRKEDVTTLSQGSISGNIKTVNVLALANKVSMTDRRLHFEVKLQTTILGTWNRFLGCQIEVLTSNPF